jgi:archaellum biogenesis ATPase FlaH
MRHSDGGVVQPRSDAAIADTLDWVKRSLTGATQPPSHTSCTPLLFPQDAVLGGVKLESAWEQLSRCSAIETGSISLDNMLHGGLQCGFVTELVGFAGVGKTCLVANWIAHAVIRGAIQARHQQLHCINGQPLDPANVRCEHLNFRMQDTCSSDASLVLEGGGGCDVCIVVSVGPNLTARRLHQVIDAVAHSSTVYSDALSQLGGESHLDHDKLILEAEDRVQFVVCVQSIDDLLRRVIPLLEEAAGSRSVRMEELSSRTSRPMAPAKRLLVIDSFATLIHNTLSSDPQHALQRHNAIASLMMRLKALAETNGFSIILVTHATTYTVRSTSTSQRDEGRDDVDLEEEDRDSSGGLLSTTHPHHNTAAIAAHASSSSCSAFGNTFFHLVNNRIVLDAVLANGAVRRVMRVIKSPVCPPVAFELVPPEAAASALTSTSRDHERSILVECVLGNNALQEATDALRRSGMHGRGVFRIPNLKYLGVVSFSMPPMWRW